MVGARDNSRPSLNQEAQSFQPIRVPIRTDIQVSKPGKPRRRQTRSCNNKNREQNRGGTLGAGAKSLSFLFRQSRELPLTTADSALLFFNISIQTPARRMSTLLRNTVDRLDRPSAYYISKVWLVFRANHHQTDKPC